jgi:hypothetical protein
MTNYNERLDEVLRRLHKCAKHEDDVEQQFADECITPAQAKQALTSLTKELVVEAKPMVASREVIQTYLQNGMTQKAAEYHGRNHAIEQFEQNLLKALEGV